MRPIGRIYEVIEQIEQYWYQYGHVDRPFDFVINKIAESVDYDSYYMEDDALTLWLKDQNLSYARILHWPASRLTPNDEMLDLLQQYWTLVPDQRFMQMYCNVTAFAKQALHPATDHGLTSWLKLKMGESS